MGQQLSKVHLDSNGDNADTSNTISSDDIKDDLSFFFPLKLSSSSDLQQLHNDQHISNLQREYIKQIQNHLSLLTTSTKWQQINTQINEKFIDNILTPILDENRKVLEEQNNRLTYKKELQTLLTTKLNDENNIKQSIFSESSIDSISDDSATNDEDLEKQLSYFGLQSLTFILFILIKSAEKHDPTLVHQILTLTNKLCEQLPMKCLSSSNNLLFKSLEPLTIYIEELSSSSNRILSKQTIEIQFYFSIAKGSFKDLLPLLNKLIFNTNETYNLQSLFINMNKYLTKIINESDKNKNDDEENKHETEFKSLNYLKSINAFPNCQLIKLNKEFFTGQMICSIILSHIDIENEILNSSSKQLNSLSCDFHPNTFKYLFYIIEKLTKSSPLDNITNHILIICLRLFTNHLQLLFDLKSNLSDLTQYATNDELKTWFDLLLKLSTNESAEEIAKEASKAVIYVTDIDSSSLNETLDLIYQYIIENKYLILIEQLLIQLNTNELLLNWIETLFDKDKQIKSLEILFSFINLYFNGEEKLKSEMKQVLFSFQRLLLSQLIIQCETKTLSNNEHQLSNLISQYLTYIFKYCIKQKLPMNDLLNSSLIGLCLMTETSKSFIYEDIQPIFISILPLLTEYYLENINNEDSEFVICLIGRMCNVLIIGLPEDSLELKHLNKFQSAIFDGGCVIDKNDDLLKSNLAIYNNFELKEEEDDKDFLMSIYGNVDRGRELILKLKSHSKDKLHLQQSIEELANDACAAMFAVYLKFYRRINLAKFELLRNNDSKPFNQLLSVYQHANRIQSLFATVKGQGGDCNELYQQIKIRTLFLLTSIKESHFIPVVEQDLSSTIIEPKAKIENQFQRQQSRWTKVKKIVKLLQNLLQACVRFRKFMLEKKKINQVKYDYESLLSQSIDQFVYGDFHKSLTSITNQEKQLEINELEKCLHRQNQRATTRLITYQFIQKFIENILNLNNNDQALKTLSIYLPYLRKNDIDWSYFNNIQVSNNQLKDELSHTYYSIIELILPLTGLAQNMFSLLNNSCESVDISHEVIETLFDSFVSSVNQSSLQLKLIAFNWFRLFVFKLCENIEIEKLRNTQNEFLEEQQKFIFHKLIFNEIKSVKEQLSTTFQAEEENSLKNVSLSWFIQSNQTMDVYLNQYLAFLLRAMYFYKHVISVCATIEYLEEFLSIYYHNQSKITQLLIIKLLGYLIPSISNGNDEKTKNLIEKFFLDALNTIGDKSNSKEIISELIFMYRQIISTNNSLYETKAREFIFNSIKSHLNQKLLFGENNNSSEVNQLVGSLCILGGYNESYRLGSIVRIETDDEISFGLIININEKDKTYLIQYLQTNQIESVSMDKLQHETAILPTNLIDPNDSIIDIIGSFIQIDTTANNNQSLILLELKRRSLCVLSHLLNDKKLIEMFMNKSYGSTLAKLSQLKTTSPSDLGVFNKRNLEEYCLSLDNCQVNKHNDLMSTMDQVSNEISHNEPITKALSKSINGWRPYAFESEVELFRKGRMGNDDFSIVPMPRHTVTIKTIEECGINHRLQGRIEYKPQRVDYDFPTFVVDNLELSEGNWYYCVRLLGDGLLVQIGWATDGFSPAGRRTGVGDDKYSWSYDGSRGQFFNAVECSGVYDDIRWKENDVCGCGIEINGKNTRIKYWLNGKLLGTAFAHDSIIASSSTECDLLPNGPTTTYYPAVTVSWESMLTTCELIFSPEDMQDCPLPNGYKPLLLPKVVQPENPIIDYPFNAYLVGDNPENNVVNKRSPSEMIVLRDFVHEEHIETRFYLDDHYLNLSDNSDGFVLSLDNINEITISFDFEILSSDNENDFPLFKLNSTEVPLKTTNETQKCVIILLLKEKQIKVYINNKSQKIFNHTFQNDTNEKLNLHLLPKISARIQNVAIWKYDLSEEEISRLFTYGLFYIKNEYEELKEYRKRVNTISFSKNQKEFMNELLLPFDEPFTKEIWERKKIQPHDNESKYFKSNENEDYSTVELFGNKTYLVLNKSDEEWCSYSFILHLLIPQYPITNEKLTIISLNSKCEIYLTSGGKLCLEHKKDKVESSSSFNINEYFFLFIRVHEQSIQIYVNNSLEIDVIVTDDRFFITSDQVDLFKEKDLTKNSTSEDQFRISLKSITYLNRSIPLDELQLPTLIEPPFEIIARNLFALGYKKHWIESVIKENGPKDLSIVLRQRKEEFIKIDLDNERKRFIKVFSKLYPSSNLEIMENVINSSQLDTKEGVNEVNEHIFTYLISSQPITDLPVDATKFREDWFSQSVEGLDIPQTINEWLQDEKSRLKNEDDVYELLDLAELTSKKCEKSIKYSHENLSSKEHLRSRIACENGLITTYARSTIANMLKSWSTDDSNLFPLEKFEDYSILKLVDYTQIGRSESVDQTYLLIKLILKNEMKHLSEQTNKDELQNKTPLFDYLQKDIMIQIIEYLFKSSTINKTSDEQTINFSFILSILNLFIEILSDKSFLKQNQIDQLIPIIFPTSLITLLFNLFLLIPINESKLSILYLFNSLLQLSELMILNNHIQQFFFQLLIDLSSDKISMNDNLKNKFQIALTDLMYILLTKENNQLEQYRTNLPENTQTLLTTIDVINAWTDPAKQKLLPEKFLERSSDILGDTYKLNQQDFEKSNADFNIIADRELVSLIKDDFANYDAISDYLPTIPTESVPMPSFYKRFLSLQNIPANSIQIRVRFIYLLNEFIITTLPTIDFTVSFGQSSITDQIRKIKLYLIFVSKFYGLDESLKATTIFSVHQLSINFDTVKASMDTENGENTMFYQAYQQLHRNAHTTFRQSNSQLWFAQYLEMHSTDAGGPYRDSITRICLDICSTRLPLFILCPNGRTSSGLNRDCWIPNVFPPNESIPIKFQKQYRFVGQLMGMAIRKKHYLDVKFPVLLWKQLLKEQITVEDIEAIDAQSFTVINEMEKNMEEAKSMGIDQDVDSVFSSIMSELRFDIVSSSGQTYELISGGKDIPITLTNFKQYCTYYREYRLKEFIRQIQFIREGLHSVIPSYYLSLFTAHELEEMVCGKGRIDVEILKRNTFYGGDYTQSSPVIERFWTVMDGMFSDEQRKLFLIFVWGRSTLPVRDEDFSSKFIINTLHVYDSDGDKTLPRSHTCFFMIDLPAYSTTDVMYDRLNYAITSCSSIDGDGMMNDAANLEYIGSDDD